jgi:hypothetical protein
VEEEEFEILEIFLHAISKVPTPQMMSISRTIQGARVILLADSGSTHNFLNTQLAERLGLAPDKNTAFEVVVANGERLSSRGKCSAVPVLLGAQWLKSLGPILWDFASLHMSFTWQGQKVTLTEINSPSNRVLEGQKMQKELRHCSKGILLQLLAVELGVE